jgi:anthranilate synthase component 1
MLEMLTLETFLSRADGDRLIPITREILADLETPLSAYWKIAHDEPHSFLLESVTGGEQLARYSILGVRPRSVLRSKDRTVRFSKGSNPSTFIPDGQDPLHFLQQELGKLSVVESSGLPRFAGGAVGMLGYDLARFFERLPNPPPDDLHTDDMAMMLVDTVVVFDHARNAILIVALCEPTEAGYERGCREIDRLVNRIQGPLPHLPTRAEDQQAVTSNMNREKFENDVRRIIDYITAGDGIQMVYSQRFSTPTQCHPVTLYRALRSLNPSPYMYLLRFGDFDLIGASPEILVSLTQGEARVRPIAGTRMRGQTEAEDEALAAELLADEKERAEHIMLVDLGRNDLGRVCEYGSVRVCELMTVERYSHVMHIVSDVRGQLRSNLDGMDLVRATFPAGTVSGAPKVRAMQIIDELEPTRRGPYAGSVGYFGFDGNLDLAITIRTILLANGMAHVQAGAGIVYDSVPAKEFEETENKARACLKAIDLARTGLQS